MSEYTDYAMIEQKIREGMYAGNMHVCLRDVGRIAGGCVASGRLTVEECERLGKLAESMAVNKSEARRKWAEATQFGLRQPLTRSEITFASPRDGGRAIGWEESVNPNDYKIVDTKWLQKEAIEEPVEETWSPCKELTDYLNLLFNPTDKVMFCTDPWNRDGKWIPNKGKTVAVEELLHYLAKNTQDGFEEAVGTLNNEESGAWIRINPFDGNGCRDENVSEYRYALIESDEKPIDEQVAIYRKMELPCACIVHSGGKSAHAIVKVFANSLEEYRKRVDFLYEVCANNGLPVDKQNRNPSRYSRMPGIVRNGKKQFIISRNCGKASWDEWENWIKDLNDNLPEFEPMTQEEFDNPPPLAPELIEGILRVNHKMCVVGPSKAGKSFLLIELAIAIAEGTEWIGHKCRQGSVLYVNLELDKSSCTHRFVDVYRAMGIKPSHLDCIERWNLRGRTMTLDKLTPKLIRRAEKKGYAAIIFDPIYKVLTGDENSASDMAEFCNNFDRIARDCGCAIVYCHHHSKGGQGDKRSMDRASGSGVFARDPDAMIDLLPLESETAKENFRNAYECEAMAKAATDVDYTDDWKQKVSQDDQIVPNRLEGCLEQFFDAQQMDAVRAARQAVKTQFDSVTGWRASFTLREFASPAPMNMWFKWPCHVMDEEDNLKDASPEGESAAKPAWQRKAKGRKPSVDKLAAFKNIIEADPNTVWTLAKSVEQFSITDRTVRRYCKQLGWAVNKGVITVPKELVQDDMPDF